MDLGTLYCVVVCSNFMGLSESTRTYKVDDVPQCLAIGRSMESQCGLSLGWPMHLDLPGMGNARKQYLSIPPIDARRHTR